MHDVEQRDRPPIGQRMQDVLRRHLPAVDGTVASDVDLLELGFDSMRVIELVLDLEETFGIVFTPTYLTDEVFATPASLDAAVRQLMAAAHGTD